MVLLFSSCCEIQNKFSIGKLDDEEIRNFNLIGKWEGRGVEIVDYFYQLDLYSNTNARIFVEYRNHNDKPFYGANDEIAEVRWSNNYKKFTDENDKVYNLRCITITNTYNDDTLIEFYLNEKGNLAHLGGNLILKKISN